MSSKLHGILGYGAVVMALGLVAALAAPAMHAQENQPAPSSPESAERAQAVAEQTGAGDAPQAEGENITHAVAVLHPTQGNNVRGVVTFTKVDGGIRIVAHVEGLTPGKHGFHAHEFGDCSAPDASSAGAHFNPTGKPHAGPDDPERHEGDFGNLEANENGVAHYDRVDDKVNLNGRNSIVGRAIIVHADPDDLKSQPSGNAGARQACGVVGVAQPKNP